MPLCPVCRCQDHAPVDHFGEFTFLRCSACTLEFCDPMQYQTSSYDSAYKAAGEGDFYVPSVKWLRQASDELSEARWMLFAAQKEAMAWLKSRHAAASILDVGCGPGWFLIRAKQLGFEVNGVEIGSEPVRALQEKGYDVVCGSIDAAPAEWTPQVVTVFEVLEHLPEPVKFLAQIKQRFPQAQLIVTVPSPRRWTKAGRHRDLADFPPNHLTRWNRASLMRALAEAGYGQLEIKYSKPSPLETAAVSLRALWQSWSDGMPDRLADADFGSPLRDLKREVVVRQLKCIPGFFCSWFFRLMGWSGISMLAIATPQ